MFCLLIKIHEWWLKATSFYLQDKEITIIHRDRYLLNGTYPDKFRTDVDKRFTDRRIHLILNDEYNGPVDGISQIVTKKGTRVQAELIVRPYL